MHQSNNGEWKNSEVHPILLKVYHGAANKILFGMVLSVVTFVMDGNDCRCGLAGAKAQKKIKSPVPIVAGKGSAMNVIVLDDASDEGQQTSGREQGPMPRQAAPLNEEQAAQEK